MRRRRHRQQQSSDGEAVINLTPLIDVVFVVLIMFIVLAPILELDQVALAPSDPHTEKHSVRAQDEHPVTVHVRADNSIWMDKNLITVDVLRTLLIEAHTKYPSATPLVFHDKRAQFGTYQEVKNALEAAGFLEMNIVLEPS